MTWQLDSSGQCDSKGGHHHHLPELTWGVAVENPQVHSFFSWHYFGAFFLDALKGHSFTLRLQFLLRTRIPTNSCFLNSSFHTLLLLVRSFPSSGHTLSFSTWNSGSWHAREEPDDEIRFASAGPTFLNTREKSNYWVMPFLLNTSFSPQNEVPDFLLGPSWDQCLQTMSVQASVLTGTQPALQPRSACTVTHNKHICIGVMTDSNLTKFMSEILARRRSWQT